MSKTDLSWHDQLDPDEQAAVRALLEDATRADGVAPVSEQVVLSLGRPASAQHGPGAGVGGDGAGDAGFGHALRSAARHAPHLLARRHGRVVGYANLAAAEAGSDEPVFAELAVRPDQRRKGVGRRLLRAVLDGAPEVRVWAHGDPAPARALAEAERLVSRRELWQMRRPLGDGADPLPEVPERDDVLVRTYRTGRDDAAVLEVNNAAFSWHPEQGGMTAEDLAEQRAQPWFDPDGFFLGVEAGADGVVEAGAGGAGGELLGFHWTKVHAAEGDDPALGEVYVVGISPRAQGRGLGRLLTLVGLHHLAAAGLPAVLLYVESDNTAAVHTYERLGFTRYHVDVAWGRPAD